MDVESGHVGAQGKITPDDVTVTDTSQELIEKTKTCPSCNYSADRDEFQTCPKCGLVIRKYYKHKQQNVIETFSGLIACKICGGEISINAPFCPKCGEPPQAGTKYYPGSGLLIACLIIAIVAVLTFWQLNAGSKLSTPPSLETSKIELSNPATPPIIAPAANLPTETRPANPSDTSADLPNAMTNTLGITKVKIVFATGVNKDKPLNDLSRISINEKQIFAYLKILIPAEKSYQFTGKLFDAEGKLVLNYTMPANPKVTFWYGWFYHDMDKTVDKPGTWKFVFLVNGEQIAEQQVEVTEL